MNLINHDHDELHVQKTKTSGKKIFITPFTDPQSALTETVVITLNTYTLRWT